MNPIDLYQSLIDGSEVKLTYECRAIIITVKKNEIEVRDFVKISEDDIGAKIMDKIKTLKTDVLEIDARSNPTVICS